MISMKLFYPKEDRINSVLRIECYAAREGCIEMDVKSPIMASSFYRRGRQEKTFGIIYLTP